MRGHDKSEGTLKLRGAVAMGLGVMIGASIFALTGQVAELSGGLFPYVFVVAAVVTGFSAYSYVQMSKAYPSAGGIAMFLEKAYGRGLVTAVCAVLMALSMVINESLVARTFATYTLQLFDKADRAFWTPVLGVGLIVLAFLINVAGNRTVSLFSLTLSTAKIIGISLFALISLWVAGSLGDTAARLSAPREFSKLGFLAALAPAILAYKGFTTITNSGGEIVNPHRNVARAIVISIAISVVIYFLVTLGVSANLTLPQIVSARDFALAEAARPALGDTGLLLTVILAMIATASGLVASIFAVSRMLTMVTEMKLVPHSHFGMTGPLRFHLLVYTVVIAAVLTVFLDLTRIASLGAILYLIMDIAVHWGVLRHLRKEVSARMWVLISAIALDAVVLVAFVWLKATTDFMILVLAAATLAIIVVGERWFLGSKHRNTA
ncbi:APC family permease [Afifella sp. IM 167]|uniref:APC family permease n=1 Tax=Afifella sp. IM 167 TaxID=2033586 RepID=UPI001CCCDEB8|nr:APC family permease [Afifella sp. IM 167]MBZ8134074.1 amino acid permease [Afifella sp. IM 167]